MQMEGNGFLFKLWIHISFSLFLEGYKNRKFANLIEGSSNVKSLSTEKKNEIQVPVSVSLTLLFK